MRETEVEAYAEILYDDINAVHHYEDANYVQYDEQNGEGTLVPVTNLEWEIYVNDKKRQIFYLHKNFLKGFIQQYKRLVE